MSPEVQVLYFWPEVILSVPREYSSNYSKGHVDIFIFVVRPRGRPKKLVPTFTLAQGEMSSVHHVPPDQVVKASSKQHIPVLFFPRFHLSFAKYPSLSLNNMSY